jgi:hypothetical protein
MITIAIDSAGHAGNPPVVMLATKHTASKGQSAYALRVGPAEHSIYKDCTSNWREKFTAALIVSTILPIYGPNHELLIDWDFNVENRRMRLQDYIRRLLGVKFFSDPTKTNPKISFSNDSDPNVKKADLKAWMAYHRTGLFSVRAGMFLIREAPNLMKDIQSLRPA